MICLNLPSNILPIWLADLRLEQLAAKSDQLLGTGADPRLELDYRFHRFAPLSIGNADHGYIGHGRMRGQSRFDFRRVDIDTTGNNHIDLAVTDIIIALFVAIGDVSDRKEAIPHIASSRVRLVIIFGQPRIARPHFAGYASRNLMTFGIEQAYLLSWPGLAT